MYYREMTEEMKAKLEKLKKGYWNDEQALSMIKNTEEDPKTEMKDIEELTWVLEMYYGEPE